jgi:hypothetical protein
VTVPAGAVAPAPARFYNGGTGSGLGTSNLTADVRVTVPANALAGSYQTTVMVTIRSGP